MIGKGQEGKRLASMSEVLEILEERKKSGELGYEQQLEFDYATKFSKMSVSEANKMKKELEELGLNEKLALKVVEVMPIDLLQLKLVLALDKKAVEEDTVNKIYAVVESYRSK